MSPYKTMYKNVYTYIKDLIYFEEIESLEELDNVHKRIVVINFLMDAGEPQMKYINDSFNMTRAILFNLLNISTDPDNVIYVERMVVEEIFSIIRGTINDILEEALSHAAGAVAATEDAAR